MNTLENESTEKEIQEERNKIIKIYEKGIEEKKEIIKNKNQLYNKEKNNIKIINLKDFIEKFLNQDNLEENKEYMDKYNEIKEREKKKIKSEMNKFKNVEEEMMYEEYLENKILEAGLEKGKFLKGVLNINKYNNNEGKIM
jgi:hypothetical protein